MTIRARRQGDGSRGGCHSDGSCDLIYIPGQRSAIMAPSNGGQCEQEIPQGRMS